MNAYKELLNGIKWVLENKTSYQVMKDLGISNKTINRYQNSTTPIENMTMKTAKTIYYYYLKERIEMNIESLNKAIEEFNGWNKAARIYLDLNDGTFETSVYASDVQMVETFSTDNYIAVFSKREIEGDLKIGVQRKEYIINYSRLLLDGWDPLQAKYQIEKEMLLD